MGKKRALKAINLEMTDRIPSFEVLAHPDFVKKISGIDPFEHPTEAHAAFHHKMDIDWVIDVPQKSLKFAKGETSKKLSEGKKITEWGVSGSVWEEEVDFHSPEDVLKYRPLEDNGQRVEITGWNYQKKRIDESNSQQEIVGDLSLVSGLYYTTLFQYGIMGFGWENFLTAAALDPKAYSLILDQFMEISRRNIEQWVKRSNSPVFLFHDDVAMTKGLVFSKDWYLKEILPRYEKLLEPAFQSGKKLVFVSDGNYMELIPEIMALGVHGLMIDLSNDLEWVLKTYGTDHVVIGNINTLTLTFGSRDDIRREVQRCANLGKQYPGYFFKSSGDLPHNIPLDNISYYFDLKNQLGLR